MNETKKSTVGETFSAFVEVVRRLRDRDGGCPWDLEQTHESLRPYVIEETYEVVEAIEQGDDAELKRELGDLLLQVVLHAQIAAERRAFTIHDVLMEITQKMVRRHPHVFGNVKVSTSDEVLRNWERMKYEERVEGGTAVDERSMLAHVPISLPALLRAQRLGEKAAQVAFDWSRLSGVWEKVQEELRELAQELAFISQEDFRPGHSLSLEARGRIEHELGDVFFSLCQLARWLDMSAENSLRGCCQRFIERFHEMERSVHRPLKELSKEELEAAWQATKAKAGATTPR